MNKKTMPYVDIAKFFFAWMIVVMHCQVLDLVPYHEYLVPMINQLAVPYFFAASGYFWARKIYREGTDKSGSITKDYCRRLGIKLLVFEPVSILIMTAGRIIIEKMPLKSIALTTLQEILFYPRGALWYMQGIIVAVLILLPLIRRGKEVWAVVPAMLLYCVGLIGTTYYFVVEGTPLARALLGYEKVFLTVRNGDFFGLPFILCGLLIARYQDKLHAVTERTGKAPLFIAALLLYFVLFLEVRLTIPHEPHDGNALFVVFPVLIPLIFYITLSAGGSVKGDTRLLRNLSTSIYLLHSPVRRAVTVGLQMVFHSQSQPAVFILTAGIVMCICALVYKKKWQPFLRWIT